ncbi:hypothetical protein BKA67DRAFT_660297 [Truncatella angustata]|uniref:Uncharacterized protein n=1 Tax=Truncatella angustata TaxID=152316 RepID=A0A9P8UG30_9PEZI|nr:uncharacterized protein BKA67DRAFT_660297 [Truncatella angustata]KAH6651488.1 hypothetical protein BKA67DRAFT_660297 [Truncatella angustata]
MLDSLLDAIHALSYGSLIGLAAIFAFAAANAKALPLVYTFRLLPSLYRLFAPRLSRNKKLTTIHSANTSTSYNAASPALFRHDTMTSRAVALDLDVNVHKSNSTFFADADISRARLLTGLLSAGLAGLGPANFVLAGVQCRFQREIRPYQAYAVSSRILAWNDRTLYVVTYFLRPGTALPFDLEVRGGPAALAKDEKLRRSVFATMVTKYVFKAGRATVAPEQVFRAAGLLLEVGENKPVVRDDGTTAWNKGS